MATQGVAFLHDSATNESTTFTQEEQNEHGLTGLLPSAVETLQTQVVRYLM